MFRKIFFPIFFVIIPIQLFAITTFTVNDLTEIEIAEPTPLSFVADVSEIGSTLQINLFIDTNSDGEITETIDRNLTDLTGEISITDGEINRHHSDDNSFELDFNENDQDLKANGVIVFEAFSEDLFPFSTHPFIVQAIDADGSTAQVTVRTIVPKLDQSISGKVTIENGDIPKNTILLLFHFPFSYETTEFDKSADHLPIITVADELGNYKIPCFVGNQFVIPIAEVGYYFQIDLAGMMSMKGIEIAEGEQKIGVDFTLIADSSPLEIAHEPIEQPISLGETITISATITDNESGIGGFSIPPTSMPMLYFRSIGNDDPFQRREMYPMIEWAFDEEDEKPTDPNEIGMRPPWGQMMRSQFDGGFLDQLFGGSGPEFEIVLTSYDFDINGIEYYIVAHDNARNRSILPIDAPATLFQIEVKPSDFTISGQISTIDGTPIEGAQIFAALDDVWFVDPVEPGFRGGMSDQIMPPHRGIPTQTRSDADGNYTVHVPRSGRWMVSVDVPINFFLADDSKPMQIIDLADEDGKRKVENVNFVFAVDQHPPMIEHDPNTDISSTFAGEKVEIRAKITDDSKSFYPNLVVRFDGDPKMNDENYFDHFSVWERSENDEWIFVIPSRVVRGSFDYAIEVSDRAENHTRSPADKSLWHRAEIAPSPYRIEGRVVSSEDQPLADVEISAFNEDFHKTEKPTDFDEDRGEDHGQMPIDPANRFDFDEPYRWAATDQNGEFSIPVKPGTWRIEARYRRGYVIAEKIEPIKIEAEGIYNVKIVFTKDDLPPTIQHEPPKVFDLSKPDSLKVIVEDDHQIRSVALRLFRPLDEFMIEPEMDENRGESHGEIGADFGNRQQDDPFWTPNGYFDWMPLITKDGKTYTVDLRILMMLPISSKMTEMRYAIEAIDLAGNRSILPTDAPETLFTVPIEMSNEISGVVTIDGRPMPNVEMFLINLAHDLEIYVHTDENGHYRLPSIAGQNQIGVSSDFGFALEEDDSDGDHDSMIDLEIEPDQNVENMDFRLTERSENPTADLTAKEADHNSDGVVDVFDLTFVAAHFGESSVPGDDGEEVSEDAISADVNGDGIVDIFDLVLIATHFGETSAAPSITAIDPKTALRNALIELNRLPKSEDVILAIDLITEFLEDQIPIKTKLYQNYPNPFNPETWIPFEISENSEVKIEIYSSKGDLIRTLELGFVSAGIYRSRSRSAFWDGRSELGERVSSGVYFYRITADNFSEMKKMVILK